MRLIHLSDPHLTSPEHPLDGRSHWGKRHLGRASWRRRRRFRHRREWLDQLTDAVRGMHPDQVLVTGDLAHIGLPEEIAEAGAWLRDLGDPQQIMLVPGNHDVYAEDSLAAVRAHWGEYLHLDDDFPMHREFADLEVIGVSSALPTRPGSACGLIGAAQLARLEALLALPPAKPRLLAIHHPPLPGMISFRKRLRDAAELEGLLRAHPVDLAVHGHDHHDVTVLRERLRVYGIGSASYRHGSFRCFDVAPVEDGWQISMALYRHGDAEFDPVEQDRWLVTRSDLE